MTPKKPTRLGKTNIPPSDYDYNYLLRNARIAKGYSGKMLGRKVGVSCYSISLYERLKSMPPKKIQERIAKVLGEDVSELFPEELKEYVRQTNEQRGNPRKVKRILNFVPLKGNEKELSYVHDFEENIFYEELQKGIEKLLSNLPDRRGEFLKLRYGFYGREYTPSEISDIYDVTGSDIRQTIKKTIEKLSELPEAWVLRKFLRDDRSQG